MVGEAAVSAGGTDTFLGERYRIIWALLSDTDAQFIDLGRDYYATRTNPERRIRHHIRELQALGYAVTLNPGA